MVKISLWGHFDHFMTFRLRRKVYSFPRKGNFFKNEEFSLRKIQGVWNS